MERPDVDLIEGLQPTIAIDQRAGSQNPRSTVATVTEIYDYLRLLMARLGEATAQQCGAAIRQQSPEEIQEELLALPEDTKLMLLAPLVRGRKGQHKEVFAEIRKAGLRSGARRWRSDRRRAAAGAGAAEEPHDRGGGRSHRDPRRHRRPAGRVAPACARARRRQLVASYQADKATRRREAAASNGGRRRVARRAVQHALRLPRTARLSFEELEPRTFSFNSPYGACPVCEGLGTRVEFDPELVLAGSGRCRWPAAPSRRGRERRPAAIERYKQAIDRFLAREQARLGHAARGVEAGGA